MVTRNPQRALRAPRPPRRPTPRFVNGTEHQTHLAARLTPRDRWLARLLAEHRVLTSAQITELAFGTIRSANRRLLALYRWRIVDRFHPYTPHGDLPLHYILDVAGATVLAHEDGLDPKHVRYRHADALGIAHSLRLAHTLGVNGVFTSLIHHARTTDPGQQSALLAWWSEARCARHFGDLVRPDGYGRWRHADHVVEFFLEYDHGTEQPTRLAHKVHDYQRLAQATGITTPVLFVLPTPDRETSARHALEHARAALNHPQSVPIATTTATTETDASMAQARWLPLTPETPAPPTSMRPDQRGRHSLAGLADVWAHLDPPPDDHDETADQPDTDPSHRQRLRPPTPMPPKRAPA